MLPNGRTVELVDAVHQEGHLGRVIGQEAVHPVAHDLRQRADPSGDHRRPAGERLDRDQAERLGPRARHEDGVADSDQPVVTISARPANKELR